jgi:hypothetical protein
MCYEFEAQADELAAPKEADQVQQLCDRPDEVTAHRKADQGPESPDQPDELTVGNEDLRHGLAVMGLNAFERASRGTARLLHPALARFPTLKNCHVPGKRHASLPSRLCKRSGMWTVAYLAIYRCRWACNFVNSVYSRVLASRRARPFSL